MSIVAKWSPISVTAEHLLKLCIVCGLCAFVQHDSTVAPFLCALKVFNGLQPPYACAVLVELFNASGQLFVEVWYRNDSGIDAEPFQMIIPG